jgi:fatty acid desaturase
MAIGSSATLYRDAAQSGSGAEKTGVKYANLGPRDSAGLIIVVAFSAVTAAALYLSSRESTAAWLAGQVLLAVALVQWFVVLHEAGHGTLFRTRALGVLSGHLASFFCVIPFRSWQAVHGLHHKWTGWQDLDPTTAALVPRELGRLERALANACWKLWIPLFSVLYRVRNFWAVPRLLSLFHSPERRRKLLVNIVALSASYGALLYFVGPGAVLRTAGLGFLLSLIFLDPLLLSQHTHIPLKLSAGQAVAPFPPLEQEVFTRSLRFPGWFSAGVLLHFDAHELHHMYPHVAGYSLRRINEATENDMEWWAWVKAAKRVPADVFMFQNRNDTGLRI